MIRKKREMWNTVTVPSSGSQARRRGTRSAELRAIHCVERRPPSLSLLSVSCWLDASHATRPALCPAATGWAATQARAARQTGNAGKGGKTGKGGKKATSVDDLPLAVTRASAEGPRRIELCTVSGNLLPATELYSKILISRRSQRPDFELEELLRPCAAYLKWPLSHIHLVCGKIIVRWHHRIAERTTRGRRAGSLENTAPAGSPWSRRRCQKCSEPRGCRLCQMPNAFVNSEVAAG